MDQTQGHKVDSITPAKPCVGSDQKGSRYEPDLPKIKKESLEDDPLLTIVDEAREEVTDEEDEGFVIDDDGVEYYEDEAFRIKQVSSPLIVNRTMKDLYYLSKGKYLKLDPEYQRDVVWDETRSSALIASIIQGYFIPPIIFNLITAMEYPEHGGPNKVKKYYRICVDGKQRLTSLIKFMDGRIGVWDNMSPAKKWFYTHPIVNGVEQPSAHLILPEKTKDFFRLRTFCCYEYNDLPESVEENMFQLVQRGMPLTPAEKLRALSTTWAVFAKQYEEDYAMVVNLSKQARASGFRAVVTIFGQICEVMSPSGNRRTNREGTGQTPILQASPHALTQLLTDEKPPSEAVKARFKEVFDKFQELVNLSSQESHTTKFGYKIIPNSAFDPAPDYLRERGVGHVKTFSPLELLATAILILIHGDSRTTGMLIGDIKEMRMYLRRAHKDLRLNPACWATVWHFVEVDLIRLRGGRGAVRKTGVTVNPGEGDDIEDNENDNDDSQDPLETVQATPVHGIRASASGNSTSQPRATRMSSFTAGTPPVTPSRGFISAKNNHTLGDNEVRDGPVNNRPSTKVPHSLGSQAVADSEASGFESFSAGSIPDATGTAESRSLLIATFSDESDDGTVFSANKKRKRF